MVLTAQCCWEVAPQPVTVLWWSHSPIWTHVAEFWAGEMCTIPRPHSLSPPKPHVFISSVSAPQGQPWKPHVTEGKHINPCLRGTESHPTTLDFRWTLLCYTTGLSIMHTYLLQQLALF